MFLELTSKPTHILSCYLTSESLIFYPAFHTFCLNKGPATTKIYDRWSNFGLNRTQPEWEPNARLSSLKYEQPKTLRFRPLG